MMLRGSVGDSDGERTVEGGGDEGRGSIGDESTEQGVLFWVGELVKLHPCHASLEGC